MVDTNRDSMESDCFVDLSDGDTSDTNFSSSCCSDYERPITFDKVTRSVRNYSVGHPLALDATPPCLSNGQGYQSVWGAKEMHFASKWEEISDEALRKAGTRCKTLWDDFSWPFVNKSYDSVISEWKLRLLMTPSYIPTLLNDLNEYAHESRSEDNSTDGGVTFVTSSPCDCAVPLGSEYAQNAPSSEICKLILSSYPSSTLPSGRFKYIINEGDLSYWLAKRDQDLTRCANCFVKMCSYCKCCPSLFGTAKFLSNQNLAMGDSKDRGDPSALAIAPQEDSNLPIEIVYKTELKYAPERAKNFQKLKGCRPSTKLTCEGNTLTRRTGKVKRFTSNMPNTNPRVFTTKGTSSHNDSLPEAAAYAPPRKENNIDDSESATPDLLLRMALQQWAPPTAEEEAIASARIRSMGSALKKQRGLQQEGETLSLNRKATGLTLYFQTLPSVKNRPSSPGPIDVVEGMAPAFQRNSGKRLSSHFICCTVADYIPKSHQFVLKSVFIHPKLSILAQWHVLTNLVLPRLYLEVYRYLLLQDGERLCDSTENDASTVEVYDNGRTDRADLDKYMMEAGCNELDPIICIPIDCVITSHRLLLPALSHLGWIQETSSASVLLASYLQQLQCDTTPRFLSFIESHLRSNKPCDFNHANVSTPTKSSRYERKGLGTGANGFAIQNAVSLYHATYKAFLNGQQYVYKSTTKQFNETLRRFFDPRKADSSRDFWIERLQNECRNPKGVVDAAAEAAKAEIIALYSKVYTS